MKKVFLLALCFVAQFFIHEFKSDDSESIILQAGFFSAPDCEEVTIIKEDTIPKNINFTPTGNYKQLKREIRLERAKLKAQFLNKVDSNSQNQFLDSLSSEITKSLINQIIPFWYGTEWDFNGYTAIPNEGEIACGYFVSTTLRDVGFNLNRYHFAQQAGWNAAKSIQKEEKLFVVRTDNVQSLQKKCNQTLKDGLYFVGLDNHVGYLLLQNETLYFIHSDYISDKVVFEIATESMAFSSNTFVICPITNNRALAKDWVLNREIPIVRG
jgi:hypothetical protein